MLRCYAECHFLFIVMLSVIVLSVVLLSVVVPQNAATECQTYAFRNVNDSKEYIFKPCG
jgi:hypothetical protein